MSTLKVDAIRHNSATSDAITTAADGTCTAKLTSVGGGQLSHRNLIINGAMTMAQRASPHLQIMVMPLLTDIEMYITEQMKHRHNLQVETCSQQGQHHTLWVLEKALKITNGNQTGGVGSANDNIQNMAKNRITKHVSNSGWNYLSDSSYCNLTVLDVNLVLHKHFQGYLLNQDSSQNTFPFEYWFSNC